MDFIAYMHFFKVTTGSFKYHLRPGSISYDVFEQLPHLNHIAIRLPLQPQQGWVDQPGQPGPPLFYANFPCPRLLHRVIYERIAEVLTPYPRVKVQGFIDDDEKMRYKALRASALQNLKWSPSELADLYAECAGGIELEDPVQPGIQILDSQEKHHFETMTANMANGHAEDSFFPPKCRCVEPCFLIFHEKEEKRRNYRVPGTWLRRTLQESQ
jgi:hypothetical protein